MTTLPKFYRPSSLRTRKPVDESIRYGIGIDDGKGGAGMIYGPVEDLKLCLEEVGSENEKIYELPSGKEMYQWNDKKECWVLI